MTRVDNNIVRLFNQNFGILDNFNGAVVTYSVKWVYNTNLNVSASGKVFLEVSPDQTPQVWTTVSVIEQGLDLSLGLTLGLVETDGKIISGVIPAGCLIRLRTDGVIPSYVKGQEAVL